MDEARTALENLRRDVEIERDAREAEHEELEKEREKTSNLQSVLEDFQLGQFVPIVFISLRTHACYTLLQQKTMNFV